MRNRNPKKNPAMSTADFDNPPPSQPRPHEHIHDSSFRLWPLGPEPLVFGYLDPLGEPSLDYRPPFLQWVLSTKPENRTPLNLYSPP